MAKSHPDLSLERQLAPGLVVCGCDEVGRGPLAGPVTAAAVILPAGGLPLAIANHINDSKALSMAARAAIAPEIRAHAVAWAVAEASVAEIEALNILKASLLAMRRAVLALSVTPAVALVDGNKAPDLPCTTHCIVKGDAKSLSIAAASILAKVDRDAVMAELAHTFPAYGWERNAGYPTPEHLAALAQHGVTPHHRRKFAPVRQQLDLRRDD